MKDRQIDVYFMLFPKPPRRSVLPFFDLTDSLKTSIIVVFLIFCFAFRVVGVSGSSMVPTLQNGDWLAVTSITRVL
ncbi:MAG: S26 family signal peptidase, partial [Clostridia bacterium]|nr:S26 family signal peptidase [Clostridia bacterium]